MSLFARQTCAECGAALLRRVGPGRPRDYCDADCANDARNRRRRVDELEALHRGRSLPVPTLWGAP